MALGIYFRPAGFTPEAYDMVIGKLDAAGAGQPAGRLYHASMVVDGLVEVFDVWESQEAFESFGAVLVPILNEAGTSPGDPVVAPVHNLIPG